AQRLGWAAGGSVGTRARRPGRCRRPISPESVSCARARPDGGPTDADLEATLDRRGLTKLRPLSDRSASLCGDAPERLYVTIALGLGGRPALMPAHLATFDAAARPAAAPGAGPESSPGASTAHGAA